MDEVSPGPLVLTLLGVLMIVISELVPRLGFAWNLHDYLGLEAYQNYNYDIAMHVPNPRSNTSSAPRVKYPKWLVYVFYGLAVAFIVAGIMLGVALNHGDNLGTAGDVEVYIMPSLGFMILVIVRWRLDVDLEKEEFQAKVGRYSADQHAYLENHVFWWSILNFIGYTCLAVAVGRAQETPDGRIAFFAVPPMAEYFVVRYRTKLDFRPYYTENEKMQDIHNTPNDSRASHYVGIFFWLFGYGGIIWAVSTLPDA